MENKLDSLEVSNSSIGYDCRKSNPVSVSTAFNMLKQMEDRLCAAKMRMQAIYMRQQKMNKQMQQQERVKMNKSLLNEYKQRNRQQKDQLSFLSRQKVQKKRDQISMSRMENKKKKSEMLQDRRTAKHDMYMRYKKQSKMWDKIIDRNKKRTLEEKQIKRLSVAKDEEISRIKVKQKLEQKSLKTKKSNKAEVQEIAKTILRKQRIIKHLEHVVSVKKVGQFDTNPEQLVERLSTLYSDANSNKNNKGHKKTKHLVIRSSKGKQKNNSQRGEEKLSSIKEAKVVMYGSHGKTMIYEKQ